MLPSFSYKKILAILLSIIIFLNSTVLLEAGPSNSLINSAASVPDSPLPSSLNPTSIKDLKAADPSAAMNVVEPPQANHVGDAQLSYPFQIPPGREGVQPQLGLGYNSSGGNGWVGMGWDLAVPAITIDTQWGVPRYDMAYETETYTLNGETMTPLSYRTEWQPRVAEKVFHLRVEGSFQKIIRHGSTPANYWWEIVDKSGTRYFYGATSNGLNPNAILTDSQGNIFKWALGQVLDLNGNGVVYQYDSVCDTGFHICSTPVTPPIIPPQLSYRLYMPVHALDANPSVGATAVVGSQLYLRKINYTQFNGLPGAYTIEFLRDSQLPNYTRRPDVIINARGGFKMVTAELLKQVRVTLNGELIRRYDLSYQEGAFRKTLLTAVTQLGEDETPFNTHSFTYYDDVRVGGAYDGFAPSSDWNPQNDSVDAAFIGVGQASAIGGSLINSIGAHIYLGFNPLLPTKNLSVGGKVGFNHSQSNGVLSLLDINGDNLPDKVFKNGGQIYFRLNLSGPDGGTTFSNAYAIPTLPAIAKEKSNTFSFGAEMYVYANVFINRAHTFTTGDVYFSDANGDGLPDLISHGSILFNYLDSNGIPTFTSNSALSPVPVGPSAVDATELIDDYEAVYQEAIDAFPLQDTVRRWVAPYDGQIQIQGNVQLVEDTSPERGEYETADGVRVAIQHNANELWTSTIAATDYTPKIPVGVESLTVQAGDRLYFRVQSVLDGAYDQVLWNPRISYLDIPATTDVNFLDPTTYEASEDFIFAGRRGVYAQTPFTGTVQLTGDLQKIGITTDDITVLVLKNGVTVLEQTMAWSETGTIAINQAFAVLPQDVFQLRVKIDSPVDLQQIRWSPSLFYLEAEGKTVVDEDGNYLLQLHPPYDMDMYPVSNLTAPQVAWTAPQTGLLTVSPQLVAQPNSNGLVTFTVKKRGELLAKQTISIVNGSVTLSPLTVAVTAGDALFFDFSVYDPILATQLSQASAQVTYGAGIPTAVPTAIYSGLASNGLWGQPYRGWGYAGYNGNRDRALQPIQEADLVFTLDANSTYDPFTAKAYFFVPFPEEGVWRGFDDSAWLAADKGSSSRLGMDFIEVPRADVYAGGQAVSRISHAAQTAVGLGAFFLSGSLSKGDSYSELDYQDMNGDAFPDITGNGRIQYTYPSGGLETYSRVVAGYGGRPRGSDSFSGNIGIGGSPAQFKVNSRGNSNTSGSQMVALGLSGSLGAGRSSIKYNLMDINGDGLPDRVANVGHELIASLNLGYSFAPAEHWGSANINDGRSLNYSLGVSPSFNGGIYDFAGGISLSKGDSQTDETLLDINGDGLLDRVSPSGDSLSVSFNTGNGFTYPIQWHGAIDDQVYTNSDISLGGGLYFTIGIGPLCGIGCYIIINPGADVSQSISRPELSLQDVNGDGYADQIASDQDNHLEVALNQTGRTNLLHTVTRPLGATFTLEYERNGNTYDLAQSRWVLASVSQYDGHPGDGADTQLTTFRYEDGYYDRLERTFYGYGRVIQEQRDTTNGNAIYRSVIREFNNDSYYTKGLLSREWVMDGANHPYVESSYTYLLRDVATGQEPANAQSTTATLFPQLIRTDKFFYESLPTPSKSTYTLQTYDNLGNIVTLLDAGEAGAADDLLALLTYSNCPNTYIMGTPTSIAVLGNDTIMRYREADVNCETGNLDQVRQAAGGGATAVTDLTYYTNGTLQNITYPANLHGQRYQVNYQYDPLVQTHITQISDSFGYTSSTTYNYKYAAPLTTTDINHNQTTYTYDVFGRTTTITGPYEQGGTIATLQFEYHPEASTPWALTKHIDSYRSATDTLDTVLFIDGLRRVIQTKKDNAIFTSITTQPQDMMTVSGHITYDFVGRTIESYYPITEPLGTPGTFNPAIDTIPPTRTTYDILDRPTSTTLPDNTQTLMAYGFGQDRLHATQFQTLVTDANGQQKYSYRNVRDLITSVQEFNTLPDGTEQVIWTSYKYDALQQIVEVRDDQDNLTTATYDLLGRRTILDNPDTGRTEMVYDTASNVIAKITANLRLEGAQISYDYEYNRLIAITYPNFTENNVSYTYGPPNASNNRAGRIVLVSDESGQEERFYGKLGEVVQEINTINSDTQGNVPEIYTTKYTYDTWGRLQTLIYPDNEVLTYRYDSGGLVREVTGQKANWSYNYVTRLEYDKFEQRAFLKSGNGTQTTYTYDPLLRRLDNLQANLKNGTLFQNLNYTYDPVGNILNLQNNVAVPPPSQYGGPTNQNFVYDDLYRLVHADGVYQFAPDKSNEYTLDLAYDTIHNITDKAQLHVIIQPSGVPILQQKTSYNWTYAYNAPQPHATSHIGQQTYTYDANGNQLGWTHDINGTRRDIVWDEENRVQSIFDNGHEEFYKYNDAGERVIKRGPQGETAYVNQFFTIRDREIGTKHVFVGETRMVSKMMKMPRPLAGEGDSWFAPRPPYEKDQYFFHPDHLGSTGYVTDADGAIYQHLEYFAFGEAWVDESSAIQRTPYRFTGKELDEETGLYYYGARYFDPRTSLWQSPDPILSTYLDGKGGMGGVFNSFNLSMYAYTYLNPIKYIDPDGNKGISTIQNNGLYTIYNTIYNGILNGYKIILTGTIEANVSLYKFNFGLGKTLAVDISKLQVSSLTHIGGAGEFSKSQGNQRPKLSLGASIQGGFAVTKNVEDLGGEAWSGSLEGLGYTGQYFQCTGGPSVCWGLMGGLTTDRRKEVNLSITKTFSEYDGVLIDVPEMIKNILHPEPKPLVAPITGEEFFEQISDLR